MPVSRKVRDLMVPLEDYAVTGVNATLREAVRSLRKVYCQVEDGRCTEAGHRSILVVDQQDKLVGIMNFRSIMNTLIPEVAGGLTARLEALGVSIAYAQADSPELDESRLGFRARVIKNAETKVGDVMLRIRGTIQADAGLMDALKALHANKITVLPVYDGSTLVGVLRDSDVFLAVSGVLAQD